MAQEIVIDIDANGDVRIEGKGIEGADCTKLTAAIEAALGDTTQQVKKPEYHRAAVLRRKAGAR